MTTVNKDVAAGNTAQTMHGPGGLFSTPGLDQAVVSTVVRPRGLGPRLPAFPSVFTNPRFGFLLSIEEDGSAEPDDICDDAPSGSMTAGWLTARFGRVFRDTDTIELGETALRVNRGEMEDFQLYGDFLNTEDSGITYPRDLNMADVLNRITNAQMGIVGVNMDRKIRKMLWSGAVSSGNGKGYKEFPGLTAQVATGQVDADTGDAIPAADSLVIDANYGEIGATGFDIVELVEAAEEYNNSLAEDTVGDVVGVVVMRGQMWQRLSAVWPVQYFTSTNGESVLGDNSRVFVNADSLVNARDRMRNAMQITINSRTYDVVIDDAIPEQNSVNDSGNLAAGEYASSIFFIPLSAGGLRVTYWQYVDWSQVESIGEVPMFWTDGGRFLWTSEEKHSCFKLKCRVEPRVVLRTPHLAWRIDNLKYRVTIHNRDWDPDSAHYVAGGVSLQSMPSAQAVWL